MAQCFELVLGGEIVLGRLGSAVLELPCPLP